MYEFQGEGSAWLAQRTRGLLGDEPGLGKTKQLLDAAAGARVLAVVPAMLVGVWEQERERWAPDLDLEIATYSRLCATTPGPRGGTATLPALRPELRAHHDVTIFDEGHYLKGRSTNWTLAAQQLRSDRTWISTGTPIPNWAPELFVLLQMLHEPGDRRWSSYWRWARRWFKVTQQFGLKVGALLDDTDEGWAEFHAENLSGVFLRRTWDDVPDQLPPLREQTIEVEMVPAQKRVYRQLKKDFLAQLPSGLEISCWTEGSQAVKLVKCSTGLESLDVGSRGSGKLDMLRELLSNWGGAPCLVACHYRPTAAAITRVVERLGLTPVVCTGEVSPTRRFELARRFQEGEGDVLVAGIEAIAEGLTLTRADRMVFVEKSYRPSRNDQVQRRIRRIGQDRPVLVVDLVTKGTVDERIRRTLARKTDQQMKALPAREFAELV